MDSGASFRTTPHREIIQNYVAGDFGKVYLADGSALDVVGMGDVRQGVLAMIAGASDYLLKPLRPDAVVASLRRALKRKRLERSLAKYQEK